MVGSVGVSWCWERGPEPYLSIPPPAQQRAVHQPCFHTDICKGREVGLDEVREGLLAFSIA